MQYFWFVSLCFSSWFSMYSLSSLFRAVILWESQCEFELFLLVVSEIVDWWCLNGKWYIHWCFLYQSCIHFVQLGEGGNILWILKYILFKIVYINACSNNPDYNQTSFPTWIKSYPLYETVLEPFGALI